MFHCPFASFICDNEEIVQLTWLKYDNKNHKALLFQSKLLQKWIAQENLLVIFYKKWSVLIANIFSSKKSQDRIFLSY